MRSIQKIPPLISVIVAAFLICCAVQAQTYRVASFSDGFGSISTAVINNSGVVVFYGERTATSGERFRGIYKGKDSVTALMEDSIDHPPASGTYQLLPSGSQHVLSLNSGGKVSFYGWKGAGSTVVVYAGGGAISRANFAFDTGKGLGTTVGNTAVTITDDGYLAYDTIVRSPTPGVLYAAGLPIGPLNNAHQFIRLTEPATNYERIALGIVIPVPNFPELRTVRTNLLKGVPAAARFAMNDRGTVAFYNGQISGNVGTFGIYKWSGGGISPVVETIQDMTTGTVSTEFTLGDGSGHVPFAINNNDEVVFYGKSRTLNREGFFSGSNPLSDKIVALGDLVDGLQMNYLRAGEDQSGLFNKKWFNDAGQIVFVGADINNTGGLFVTSGVNSPPGPVSAVYRWNPPVSPPNGSFGVTNNWQPPSGDPPRVPQKTNTLNDTALFDRPEIYTVTVGQQHVERLLVKNGNVTFQDGNVRADALSFQSPSVVIDNARLTLSLTNPAILPLINCNHALIGESAAGRVDVTAGAEWACAGSLRVGGHGEGILTIDTGGNVTSGEGRIGGGGGGHVNVGAAGSWTSGNLAIGIDGGDGDLTIQDGGTVQSELAVIGQDAGTVNTVIVQGNSDGGAPSTWSNETLGVGSRGGGRLEVRDGASVTADILKIGNESLISGTVIVNGSGTNSSPSQIMTELLFVGSRGSFGELRIEAGGLVEASGEQVSLGSLAGRATVIVDGVNSGTGDPSTLRLTNPDSFLALGEQSAASLVIRGGGLVEMDPQGSTYITSGMAGEPSEIIIDGATSKLKTGQLFVGNASTDTAFLTLVHGTVDASFAFVGPRGVIRGVGTLTVDPAQRVRVAGGTISPGLSPGVLTIQGSYEQRFDGNLLIEIGGTNSAAHDQLVVTGDAELDGNVTFRFINGFAPKTGDRIDFLNVPTVNGAFANFALQNLAPGFQFDISTNGSLLSMTALNDGVFDPALPGQVLVTVTNVGGITYAICTATTDNTCTAIALDGALTRTNNTFTQAFVGTRFVGGDCFPQDVTTTNILVLGALPPGDYSFNIVSAGQTIATVPFTAVSSTETLLNPTRTIDGSIQFQLNGLAPVGCVIEASPDLINWTELDQQILPANFTDFDAALFPQRFYRARIGP